MHSTQLSNDVIWGVLKWSFLELNSCLCLYCNPEFYHVRVTSQASAAMVWCRDTGKMNLKEICLTTGWIFLWDLASENLPNLRSLNSIWSLYKGLGSFVLWILSSGRIDLADLGMGGSLKALPLWRYYLLHCHYHILNEH